MSVPTKRITVRDVANPSMVFGVHGAPGITYWKAAFGRRDFSAPVEASEWAALPPGGVSGEHCHTRTEEIYVILHGHGEFILDGDPVPVGPGSVGLTGLGHTHGLRNTSDRLLEWWVTETIPPSTNCVLEEGKRSMTGQLPGKAGTVDLTDCGEVDVRKYFQGPMRRIWRMELKAGDFWLFSAENAEVCAYFASGTAVVTNGNSSLELKAKTAVTISSGEVLEISAQSDVIYYAVELEV